MPIFTILLMLLAPIAATLINLAISRSCEFEADADGARICGHPEALASALAKIEQRTQMVPMNNRNPALSCLFLVMPRQQTLVCEPIFDPSTNSRENRAAASNVRRQFHIMTSAALRIDTTERHENV